MGWIHETILKVTKFLNSRRSHSPGGIQMRKAIKMLILRNITIAPKDKSCERRSRVKLLTLYFRQFHCLFAILVQVPRQASVPGSQLPAE